MTSPLTPAIQPEARVGLTAADRQLLVAVSASVTAIRYLVAPS